MIMKQIKAYLINWRNCSHFSNALQYTFRCLTLIQFVLMIEFIRNPSHFDAVIKNSDYIGFTMSTIFMWFLLDFRCSDCWHLWGIQLIIRRLFLAGFEVSFWIYVRDYVCYIHIVEQHSKIVSFLKHPSFVTCRTSLWLYIWFVCVCIYILLYVTVKPNTFVLAYRTTLVNL